MKSSLLRKYAIIEKSMIVLSAIIVVAMMFLTAVDVVLRYVFNSPIQDSFQLSQFMMVGIVFLGISYMQSIRGHVTVEFLASALSPKAKDIITIFGLIIGLFIYAIVTWKSGIYAWSSWKINEYTMGIIHYPLWPAKLAVPLGTGTLCLRLIIDIIHDIIKLLSKHSKE
jgi:TRAP-type C4-dicarboxylate transport system permease small subunit